MSQALFCLRRCILIRHCKDLRIDAMRPPVDHLHSRGDYDGGVAVFDSSNISDFVCILDHVCPGKDSKMVVFARSGVRNELQCWPTGSGS